MRCGVMITPNGGRLNWWHVAPLAFHNTLHTSAKGILGNHVMQHMCLQVTRQKGAICNFSIQHLIKPMHS